MKRVATIAVLVSATYLHGCAAAAIGTSAGVATGFCLGAVALSDGKHSDQAGEYLGSGMLLGAIIGGVAAGVASAVAEDSGRKIGLKEAEDASEREAQAELLDENKKLLEAIRRERAAVKVEHRGGNEIRTWSTPPADERENDQ
jgi:hypothetical protein